jgi:hypothetical protein
VAGLRVDLETEIQDFVEKVGWRGMVTNGLPHTTQWSTGLTGWVAAIHRELIAKAETMGSRQRVVLYMNSSEGDCLAAKLRPGNLHSAEDWEELLLPESERQQKLGKQVVFRADAAFAKPEIYEAL